MPLNGVKHAVCLKCHDVKQGEVLGAFVYEFAKQKAEAFDQPLQLLVKAAVDGRSMEELARGILKEKPSGYNEHEVPGARGKVRSQLLDAGVVTGEMVADQTAFRKTVLGLVDKQLNKPKTAAASGAVLVEPGIITKLC